MKDIVDRTIETNVVWLGKAQEDEYYQYCAQEFEIIDFDDPYKMTAELLKHIKAKAVIINSAAFSDAYNKIAIPLITSSVIDNIYMYSHRPIFSSSKPNRKVSGIKFASSPSELIAMLKELLNGTCKPKESTVVAETEDQKQLELQTAEQTAPEPKEKDKNEKQEKPFAPAELTADELQALLGPDYKLDIDLDSRGRKE